jgi:predicted Fe-Mo cluster-binding NifX family protein
MKIAVSSDGPDLRAKVGYKLGTSRYLIIFDVDSLDYEAVPNPAASGKRGTGIQAVMLAVNQGVNTIVTGYCSPAVKQQLETNGINVLTGISGTVGEYIERFRSGELGLGTTDTASPSKVPRFNRKSLIYAARSSARQFITLLPILIGVVLLIGLFNAFVSRSVLASIFSGNTLLDTVWGACFGSILAGNPINSYVIGGELLKYDISLFAVTALIVTWVTVGLVQLPAEIAAMGKRFAIIRNGLSFILSIPIAIVTVLIMNLITG